MATSSQKVGEELIGTCVMPTKIKAVQQTLGQERERHLCALKLLQSFFPGEELANSNTDGTYGKKCLDSAKLNSLKVLVFTKFPASANEDKEKVWRCIKSKINSSVTLSTSLPRKTLLIVYRNHFPFLINCSLRIFL